MVIKNAAAETRYMIRCCYCKQTFAIESAVAPWQMSNAAALAVVERHAAVCPTTTKRLEFRAHGRVERFIDVARDVLTADWKIETVNGRYNPAIKCGARCLNAKHGDCECSCGGAHHGEGMVAA